MTERAPRWPLSPETIANEEAEHEAWIDAQFAAPPKITRDTQPTLSVTLWRCVACEKWSHAKRRPKHHQVTVNNEPDEGTTVLEVLYATADPEDHDAWIVACGPFEKWEAWKVEDG